MKLFIPVAGILFAIGACCCGDMDQMTEQMKDLNPDAATTPAPTEVPTVSGSSSAPVSGSASASGTAVDGACGRYKDWGLTAPSGFKVVACSDDAGSGGIVLQGAGSPADACKAVKAWAEGAGGKVTMESSMGAETVMLTKDTTQITAACTDATGQTTISIALSAM